MLSRLKRFLFGIPIRSEHAHHERLTKFLALPVFSSDALSSVAYGTEEILRVLVLCIPFAMSWNQVDLSTLEKLIPISIGIAVLLIIVVISYIQTIFAYPGGGGSYIVSSENLGSVFGRIAGGSLLIDYTLTVAVSISAGVAAIVSAFPGLSGLAVEIALALLAMITWANLRGVRESGAIFALPTYSFIVGIFIMLGVAFWKFVIMGQTPAIPHNISPAEILPTVSKAVEPITLFFLLRAFSAGCTALTGIEAISDGVAAFRKPESRNAAITLGAMGSLLVVMFLGISWLANFLHIMPITEGPHYQTVLSQIARATLDSGGLYFFIQIATMSVLVLAANTAFADFPRLSYFMARDGFLPRQLMAVGDRLVYQNGIVTLAAVAGFLIWTHEANAH
ncbi:MAG: APC family permease, partial [bacterium]